MKLATSFVYICLGLVFPTVISGKKSKLKIQRIVHSKIRPLRDLLLPVGT